MSGSIYGKVFSISTWGESHGKALGVTIDGCPSGIALTENDIQNDLDLRKPGSNKYGTKRKEGDRVEILSGVFEGVTTGTPISLIVYNEDQKSRDYGNLSTTFRPGHADFTFDGKYGIRDYRGGGRSSGRETLSRVAAGAIARKILAEIGVEIKAYTYSIGEIAIEKTDMNIIRDNPLFMPDEKAYEKASKFLDGCIENKNSAGGIVECLVTGMPVGIGETVFDKLDANIAKAMFSLGGVKGFEVGLGFEATKISGFENNDKFFINSDGEFDKETNNSGGILGGMSDGSDLIFRVGFKPTPSISMEQKTVNKTSEEVEIVIKGRHDPIIVPRAVIVVEAMAAITLVDLMFQNMYSKIENVKKIYKS